MTKFSVRIEDCKFGGYDLEEGKIVEAANLVECYKSVRSEVLAKYGDIDVVLSDEGLVDFLADGEGEFGDEFIDEYCLCEDYGYGIEGVLGEQMAMFIVEI